MEDPRRGRRERRLLAALTPSPAYDNEVLRALDALGAPARVGDIASLLIDRWPANRPHLTMTMWSGQRLAHACQRIKAEGLLRTEPVRIGSRATASLAYSLTPAGVERARGLIPNDPRPREWR